MKWVVAGVVVALVAWFAPGQAHDGIYDWLTAKAVLDGGDPYLPLSDLAETYGLAPDGELPPHPRLPAAHLLQLPLGLLPVEHVGAVMRAVVAAALFGVTAFVRPSWTWLVLAVPAFHAVWYGNTSAVVTLLIAVAVARGLGWPVGLAAGLRAWPWFLGLVFLVTGRWKAAGSAAGVFVGLNLVGLLLPAVTWEGTVGLFTEASERYVSDTTNLMSYLPVWAGPIVAALVLLIVWRRPRLLAVGVFGALAASPVLWLHYLTALAVPLGEPRGSCSGAQIGGGDTEIFEPGVMPGRLGPR